ncbi:MAG: hypothetical protein JWO78_183 [Micavibrio sp.]|nr:hypothetical protein [Micavibrio sp.]
MKPKAWREKQGLSFEKLGEMLGFSPGYLCDVEGGKKTGSVRLAKAYKKASKGEVTLEDFFSGVTA